MRAPPCSPWLLRPSLLFFENRLGYLKVVLGSFLFQSLHGSFAAGSSLRFDYMRSGRLSSQLTIDPCSPLSGCPFSPCGRSSRPRRRTLAARPAIFASSGVAAHPRPGRVHKRQSHVLVAVVLLPARGADRGLALGADVLGVRSLPLALFARDLRRVVAGENRNRPASLARLALAQNVQIQFCGGAKVVLVAELQSRPKHALQRHSHVGLVPLAADVKGAQVSAALDPGLPEQGVQIRERRLGRGLQTKPVGPRMRPQIERRECSARSFGAVAEMTGDGLAGKPLATRQAGPGGFESSTCFLPPKRMGRLYRPSPGRSRARRWRRGQVCGRTRGGFRRRKAPRR
jgi:hypothetical protein